MFHVHLRRKCILLHLGGKSWRYKLGPFGLIFHLRFVFHYWFSVLMICPDDLSNGVSGVLKSPSIIVLLLISLLMPVLISLSVMSDSLRPHRLQHARLPCPSPTTRVYPNSCPSSQWCHPTISSSVISFSSRLQSFPASGSFPMSPFFASDGQSIEISASASVLPMNIQDWFPLGLTGLISLQSKGLSKVFSNTTV